MVVGWVYMTGLPTRWLTRELNGVRQFMGADNQIFPTFTDAYDYLYKNKEKFEISQMTTFYSTFSKYSFQTAPTPPTASSVHYPPKQGRRNSNINRRKNNDNAFMKLKTVLENNGSDEQLKEALKALMLFGWYSDPKLPKFWLKFNPIRQPVQYLVYKPFCAKFIDKNAAVNALTSKMNMGDENITREYIVKFLIGDDMKIEHELGKENDDDWFANHESVPEGWKIRKSKTNPSQYEYLSPENICFKNRVSPLQLMSRSHSNAIFNDEDIADWRDRMHHEGWVKNEALPQGWLINQSETKSRFMSRDGNILTDTNSVVNYIMEPVNKISSTERKTLMSKKLFFNTYPTKIKPLIFNSKVEKKKEQPKLPKDWTMEQLSEKVIKITAASGDVFFSRLQAIEYMIENDVDEDIIYGVWKTLDEEEWIFECNYVPTAWGVRKQESNVLFLTKELVVLTSVDEALDYIENDDEYEPKDYKVLNDWKEIYVSANWIKDSHLPEGWRKTELRMESDEEESQTEHFLAPNTNIYNGRVAMIQKLIQDQHPVDEIYKLWTTLDQESWMQDSHQVPLGWKIRFDCELNQDEYLSPDMKVYTSKQDVLKLVAEASLPGEKIMAEHIKQWSQFSL